MDASDPARLTSPGHVSTIGSDHTERGGRLHRAPATTAPRHQASVALLGMMSEGAVVLDARGHLLACNERFSEMTGFPAFVMLGDALDDYFSAQHVAAYLTLSIEGRAPERSRGFTLRHIDGSTIPVAITVKALPPDETGATHLGAVITDVRAVRDARRKHIAMAEQLAYEIQRRVDSDERLARTLQENGSACWECDLGSGKGVYGNGMARLFGVVFSSRWRIEDIIERFIPADREVVRRAFDDARRIGSVDVEARITTVDRSARWMRLRARPASGSPGVLAGLATDTTAWHDDRDRIRPAADMESVGVVAAGIAHDMNNFLQVIGNNLELLDRQYPEDGRIARLNAVARHALLRAAKLSQQLLSLSRGQDLEMERLQLERSTDAIRALLARALPGSVSVRTDVADALWPCMTSLHQLESALLNLAINARDAMPDGGELALTIANRTIGPELASSAGVTEGDYVTVGMSDTGTGMSPEIAVRASEPFFTTKAAGKGTGLGLSQVYAFAKRSGGFVTIETSVGKGSRVTLFMPRTE